MHQALSPRPQKPYAALPLAWALIMLVLTLTPAQDMPRTPEWKFLSFDTAAHVGVFAVLAVLSWFSGRRQRRWPWLAAHTGLAVLAGCIVFGGLIEVLQYAMNLGRHAEWTDLVGDSIGAALALLLLAGGTRWRQRPALATLFLLALATPAAHAQPTEPDLARARGTIEKLASPQLHGRGYVQGGEHLAAAYLRKRFKQLGLQPLAPDYTQPFGLDVNTFPGRVALRFLEEQAGVQTNSLELRPGIDFIVSPGCPSLPLLKCYLDYPDSLIYRDSTANAAWLLVGRLDPVYTTALLISQADDKLLAQASNQKLAAKYGGASQLRIEIVPKLTASVDEKQDAQPRVQVLRKSLPDWVCKIGYPLVELQVDAHLILNYQTQNLAAVVRGRTQPDSFLVVTAHYDHLGMMGKSVYFPGANDNASGVALLLELAAHYARPENQPTCSVVFLLFGAEEAGLVGSSYFVQHPLVPLRSIKFLVNLDLLGTGEEGATVVNGKVLPVAFQRLTALNDLHHYLPKLGARGPAANSDHYPFSQAGVPAFFLYTRGGSLAYHDVNDKPAALSLAGFAGAYGLVRDFLDGQGAGLGRR